MMKLSKALMLSVSGLIFTSNGSAASMYDSTSFNSPDAITFVHTHTSHPEEILLSSPDLSFPGQPLIFLRHGNNLSQKMEEIKTAATCFVTDTSACSGNEFAGNNADDDGHGGPGGPGNGDDDYDLDNEERCKKEGYTMTSCPEGQEGSNFCPYDSSYFEECVNSCPSNYVTCEKPYYGVGEACDGKYASCEKDTERACQELNPGYVDECGTGQQLSDGRCSYDNTYGTCCNTCAGYDYTSVPDGYVQDGESCTGCDGQEHYKIKPNPCDGYMDCGSMGPDTGANSCLSGTTTKYDNCKPCPNLGTLTSCPSPFTCTYEDCSGLWYKTGCKSGYDWNASSQTCTAQCSSNYKYACTGAGYAGGSGTACNGKYQSCKCSDGYEWKNGICQEKPKAVWGQCTGYAQICKIGDIVYSDGTCASSVISGKTPIAVVVYKSSDGKCAQAMALNKAGTMAWSRREENVPKLDDLVYASTDFKSCENTAIITAAGNKNEFPAAWAAHEYKTEGTNAGNWCLPAAGIITNIKNNISTINNGFNLAGGNPFETNPHLWSSSENSNSRAWYSYFRLTSGLYNFSTKWTNYDVRPVIEF